MAYQFESNASADAMIGVDIRVPDHWMQYDLSDNGLAGLRTKIIQEAGDTPEGRAVINDFFVDLAQVARQITESGLVSAAGSIEKYDDGIFMANACVFSFLPPRGYEMDPLRMVDHIHPPNAVEREGAWLERGQVELLHSGARNPCGRAWGVTDHILEDGSAVRSVVMHTAFDIPGIREKALVTCSSPNVAQQEEVLDLFDAITGTAWFWKREPNPAAASPTI